MSDPPLVLEINADGSGKPPVSRPMTPDEIALADATAAAERSRRLAEQHAVMADNERLRVINERARTDPAYAALADLALGGQGR